MSEIHDSVVSLGDQLSTLCNTNAIKGRKADKIAENFMWNISVLRTEMDLLTAIKDDCDCALKQVINFTFHFIFTHNVIHYQYKKSTKKYPVLDFRRLR